MTLFILWSKTLLSRTVLFYVFSVTFYLNKIMWIIKVTSKGRCWINQEESLSHPEQLSGCLPPSVWKKDRAGELPFPMYVWVPNMEPEPHTVNMSRQLCGEDVWSGFAIPRALHCSCIHPSFPEGGKVGKERDWQICLLCLNEKQHEDTLSSRLEWNARAELGASLHLLKQGPMTSLSLGISRRNRIKKDWAAPFTSKNAQ